MQIADKIKLVFAVMLLAGGIAAFYYLSQMSLSMRIGFIVLGLALGLLVAWLSAPGKQFVVFAQEAIDETKRVVWPTRKETLQTTAVVFVFVVIMALFLWIVDAGLLSAVKWLMGRGE
jgi:preprotein translocase subunit SecE